MSKKKRVLSKFVILCWAAFIAILVHRKPIGRALVTHDTQWNTTQQKKKEALPFATARMELENILLSEISQSMKKNTI